MNDLAMPATPTTLVARIGEIRVGAGSDRLKATLGSCVGIAFLWRRRGRFGLAHCLLPDTAKPVAGIGAKYVSQAVPSLLAAMEIRPGDHDEIEAVIAGGANMIDFKHPSGQVGTLNAATATRLVGATGIRIVHTETGGRHGRQITIDCAQAGYAIREIQRQF
ncbi:MAG: chemotaxis protein CheD [Burkholderiaceae bacterium]